MSKHSFVRHAAVYGMANLLIQGSGFFLLPIYIRCLKPEEYGLLEVLCRMAETVSTVLLLGGFRQALFAFYQQAEDQTERRRVVVTSLLLVGCSCIGGGLLIQWFAGPITALSVNVTHDSNPLPVWLFRLAIMTVLLEPFCLFPLALIQARMQSIGYLAVTLSQFLIRMTLCILLVRGMHGGVAGALLSTVLTGSIFGIGLTVRELMRGLAWPDLKQMVGLVRFALPMVPAGLCFFVLHQGDRFLLYRFNPASEVGTYALGYKLAQAAHTFSLQPLFMVWCAQVYEAARRDNAPTFFGQAFTRILGIYMLVSLAGSLFQDEVVMILGGEAYRSAAHVVSPIQLALLFLASSILMDSAFYIRRRTDLKLWITVATTVVMIALYLWLIPAYGSLGAALATMGGFAFLALATWVVTSRIFPVRYEWGRLSSLLAMTATVWLVGRALPATLWYAPVKVGLWALLPVLAWQSGLILAEEKDYIRSLISLLYGRFRGILHSASGAGNTKPDHWRTNGSGGSRQESMPEPVGR